MKIHHLNCASFCPTCKKLLTGNGGWLESAQMCSHCLLIESKDGLVLVDTGLGVNDVLKPKLLGNMFRTMMQPQLKVEETAVYQLDKMGYRRHDVKHIILTHLDLDHAGGISDFPGAKVHADPVEVDAALAPQRWTEKARYRSHQFSHNPHWQHPLETDESWFGFNNVRRLNGINEDILLVPLAGHTKGHCGVAIKQKNNKWLFHVGDLYMDRRSLFNKAPKLLNRCENFLAEDNRLRLKNMRLVKKLLQHHADQVEVFSAHDQQELNQFL